MEESKTHIPLGIYKHFKGGMYETIGVAYHSEDNKPLVIYKSLADGRLWARPVDMWVDIIDGEHPRFKMISTLENYEKAKHNK